MKQDNEDEQLKEQLKTISRGKLEKKVQQLRAYNNKLKLKNSQLEESLSLYKKRFDDYLQDQEQRNQIQLNEMLTLEKSKQELIQLEIRKRLRVLTVREKTQSERERKFKHLETAIEKKFGKSEVIEIIKRIEKGLQICRHCGGRGLNSGCSKCGGTGWENVVEQTYEVDVIFKND